jgi:hypothetical protein
MNPFKWFIAGPEAATKALEAGIRGLDALVFTDEERLEYQRKMADAWIKLQEILGEETTVRGVTRRILAVMFTGAYLILSFLAVGMYAVNTAYADFIWEVCNGQLGWITLTVAAFYFGPYFLTQLVSGKKAG